MNVWVLVLFLTGAGDGGRAINTSLTYTSQEACETEMRRLSASQRNMNWPLWGVCLYTDKVYR